MSENARKLVKDVGSVHVDMTFVGYVVKNAQTKCGSHMDVVNDLVAAEMDYYDGPISVGRPYWFDLRVVMDIRRGLDGEDYLAFEQTFSSTSGITRPVLHVPCFAFQRSKTS